MQDHGAERVVLGGRKVAMQRPRARIADGEVALTPALSTKYMKLMKAVGIALVLAMSSGAATIPQAKKPVYVNVHHSDGGPREPRGLDSLLEYSALVVEGVVEGARPADRVIRIPEENIVDVFVRTAYRIRVNEVFQAAKSLGPQQPRQIVDVFFSGIGRRDRGSYVDEYVNDDLTPLREGDSYLLFLKPLKDRGGYELATESDVSVFAIRGTSVVPLKLDSRASSKMSRSWPELQATLRTKGKARFQWFGRGERESAQLFLSAPHCWFFNPLP